MSDRPRRSPKAARSTKPGPEAKPSRTPRKSPSEDRSPAKKATSPAPAKGKGRPPAPKATPAKPAKTPARPRATAGTSRQVTPAPTAPLPAPTAPSPAPPVPPPAPARPLPAPAVSSPAPPTPTLPTDQQAAGSPAPSPAPAGGAAAPLLYLAGIVLAEVAIRAGSQAIGVAVYGVMLIASLNRGAVTPGPVRMLHLGIALATVGRLLSITAAPEALGALYYLLLALPVPIGIVLLARRTRGRDRDLGLVVDLRIILLSFALIPFGLLLGYLYQVIGRPRVPWSDVSATSFLAPALLVAWAGIVEEVLFRGLLQGAAIRRLGLLPGVIYVAALYTVVVGVPWSIAGTAFVFATAVWLAGLRVYTGSVVPAAVAHASLNIGLLFLAWFLQGRV